MNSPMDTILAQYANSPTIVGLVESFNQCIDPSKDIDLVFSQIFDIDTAEGFGLDIWGRILGISRDIKYKILWKTFGFRGSGLLPFNQGTFAHAGGSGTTTTFSTTDAFYRRMLIAKAMTNISDASIVSINAVLAYLFEGRGRVYAQDTGDMQIRYVFSFNLTSEDRALINTGDIIPRPAGVLVKVLRSIPASTFGFRGSGLMPFDQGTFFSDEIQ